MALLWRIEKELHIRLSLHTNYNLFWEYDMELGMIEKY